MFVRKALAFITLAFASAFISAWAQTPGYAPVSPPQPTEATGKVEVIEFFWYGCPHCYHLEPEIAAWLKKLPGDVAFKRVPAVPSDSWGELARVFYTFEAMGLLEQHHARIFDAIHKDNQNLGNRKIREQWLAKNGIDPKKYEEVEKSFTVATKLQRAKQMTQAYKVDSVPRFVVQGKYYTSAELAGGASRMFEVVDELIAKVRKENGTGAAAPAKKK